MTEFKPFSGWRYNGEKVAFSEVMAPPYDVISPAQQDALYEQSPYNCIRVILNRILDSDSDADNRYTRANGFFNDWKGEQVLIQENQPAYYLYNQTFKDPETGESRSRRALFGRLKLEPFENEVVIPHEKTLSKPKKDRLQLLETTHTNFSPIFGLYEDPQFQLKEIFDQAMQAEPLYEATDEDQVEHSLWALSNAADLEKIEQHFQEKKVYIADGHHRYQTSLDYSLAQREKNAEAGDRIGSDYTLVALVEFDDPGLALFPTHRLLRSLEKANGFSSEMSMEDLMTPLAEFFEIQNLTQDSWQESLSGVPREAAAFVFAWKGEYRLLKVKDWAALKDSMPEGHADLWYQLDVNVIPHFVLAHSWGITEADWESLLAYTHDADEAKDWLEDSQHAAFLMRAPKVQILRDMGDVKELMAQKSTYFYPKLASGLVFYNHDQPE